MIAFVRGVIAASTLAADGHGASTDPISAKTGVAPV